jgi:hypothetical protein
LPTALTESVQESVETLLTDPDWIEFLKGIPVVGTVVVLIRFILKLLRRTRIIVVPEHLLNKVLQPTGLARASSAAK